MVVSGASEAADLQIGVRAYAALPEPRHTSESSDEEEPLLPWGGGQAMRLAGDRLSRGSHRQPHGEGDDGRGQKRRGGLRQGSRGEHGKDRPPSGEHGGAEELRRGPLRGAEGDSRPREEEEESGGLSHTCHLLAAGVDMTSKEAVEKTMALFDALLGVEEIRVGHLND